MSDRKEEKQKETKGIADAHRPELPWTKPELGTLLSQPELLTKLGYDKYDVALKMAMVEYTSMTPETRELKQTREKTNKWIAIALESKNPRTRKHAMILRVLVNPELKYERSDTDSELYEKEPPFIFKVDNQDGCFLRDLHFLGTKLRCNSRGFLDYNHDTVDAITCRINESFKHFLIHSDSEEISAETEYYWQFIAYDINRHKCFLVRSDHWNTYKELLKQDLLSKEPLIRDRAVFLSSKILIDPREQLFFPGRHDGTDDEDIELPTDFDAKATPLEPSYEIHEWILTAFENARKHQSSNIEEFAFVVAQLELFMYYAKTLPIQQIISRIDYLQRNNFVSSAAWLLNAITQPSNINSPEDVFEIVSFMQAWLATLTNQAQINAIRKSIFLLWFEKANNSEDVAKACLAFIRLELNAPTLHIDYPETIPTPDVLLDSLLRGLASISTESLVNNIATQCKTIRDPYEKIILVIEKIKTQLEANKKNESKVQQQEQERKAPVTSTVRRTQAAESKFIPGSSPDVIDDLVLQRRILSFSKILESADKNYSAHLYREGAHDYRLAYILFHVVDNDHRTREMANQCTHAEQQLKILHGYIGSFDPTTQFAIQYYVATSIVMKYLVSKDDGRKILNGLFEANSKLFMGLLPQDLAEVPDSYLIKIFDIMPPAASPALQQTLQEKLLKTTSQPQRRLLAECLTHLAYFTYSNLESIGAEVNKITNCFKTNFEFLFEHGFKDLAFALIESTYSTYHFGDSVSYFFLEYLAGLISKSNASDFKDLLRIFVTKFGFSNYDAFFYKQVSNWIGMKELIVSHADDEDDATENMDFKITLFDKLFEILQHSVSHEIADEVSRQLITMRTEPDYEINALVFLISTLRDHFHGLDQKESSQSQPVPAARETKNETPAVPSRPHQVATTSTDEKKVATALPSQANAREPKEEKKETAESSTSKIYT